MLEKLEKSFGGYFLFGLCFVLEEVDQFPHVGYGESVRVGLLFGGQYDRLKIKEKNTFYC